MTAVMKGVRILEVAEHTFVPAASALLADWGAEVIKIEHVERGDAMRGLMSSGLAAMLKSKVHVLLEHSNRGKKSLALDLGSEAGLDILYRLAATCDVFLTNKLPGVRAKLKIDVEHLRAHNPKLIYVRGTGHGERGPDADRGSYDALAYWCRSGIAMGMKHADENYVPAPPGPAFGDSIGAMTIAGGIMGALFHRERTGEATIVDVSLLGTALWSHGAALALSLQLNRPWAAMPKGAPTGNPLVRTYRTKDDRYISICCLQGAKYWPGICEVIGQPALASDERFADAASLTKNAAVAAQLLDAAFAERTAPEWRERLASFAGQWAMVQDTLEAAVDPQTTANGYVVDCQTADGTPFKLAAAPVQFDEQTAIPTRGPEFNEHGDAILAELGLDWDAIIELKARGVVA
jgi:crotonobetainyl-CoA:carnitine CoA-transferase CaiB-like acyl-CoA transferase